VLSDFSLPPKAAPTAVAVAAWLIATALAKPFLQAQVWHVCQALGPINLLNACCFAIEQL